MDDLQERIDALEKLIHQPMKRNVIPRKDDPEWIDRKIKPVANVDGARILIHAIVGELTADYVHHARKLMAHPNDNNSRRELRETENFIHTTLFARLTQAEIGADEIIHGMRQNVFDKKFERYKPYKEENRLRKKIEQEKRKEYSNRGKKRTAEKSAHAEMPGMR